MRIFILVILNVLIIVLTAGCSTFSNLKFNDSVLAPISVLSSNMGNTYGYGLDEFNDEDFKNLDATPKSPFVDHKNKYKVIDTGFKVLYVKSKIFNFYNFATIDKKDKNNVEILLYNNKKPFGKVKIRPNSVCFMGECSYAWPASKEFFGSVAYNQLFSQIVLGLPIFHGLGTLLQKDGVVVQRFIRDGQLIFYKVDKEEIIFQNFTNGIVISIKPYKIEVPNN